ncbi:TPA: rhodanese-like domain-containing protein [Enterococcus faecalis]
MYNTIGMPEFYQEAKRKKLSIIDVREEMEYQLGHVPQAINLPLSTLTENYQQLDKKQPYYLICQMGSRSAQACAFLSQQGYQATNVLGGTSGWLGQLEQ